MAARLMGRRWLGFAGVLVGLVVSASGARAAERRVERDIAPGVHLTQILREGVALPLVATALTIDPKTPGLRLETPLASGHISDQSALKGRATVSALAVRENALVAVNGDFFPFTGDPLGLLIHKGELISEPNPLRSVVGFARGKAPVFGILSLQATVTVEAPDGTTQSTPLSGLNRARGTNELILYTPVFGATTATNRLGTEAVLEGLPLPLSCGRFSGQVRDVLAGGSTALAPGQVVLSGHGTAGEWLRRNVAAGNRVTVELRLAPSAATTTSADAWCALREVVGGGPFLLRKGAVAVDWVAQKMQPDITAKRAPRTAIGVTREGKIVLAAIDGRQPFSAGTTLDETARLMQQLGAVDAMNLDGGGSTAMALLGVIVNSPSGGAERPVADGVALVADQLPSVPDPGELAASPLTATVSAGSVVALRLRSPGTPNATDAPANTADPSAGTLPVGGLNPVGLVWSCQGPGFVSQDGYFRGTKAGTTTVVARVGGRSASFQVTTVPGDPVALTASAVAAETSANVVTLNLAAEDAYHNPTAGRTLTVLVDGSAGKRPPASVILSDKGAAKVSLEFTPGETGRKATFTCGGATYRWVGS